MTLDETIKYAEEVAEAHTKYNIYGGFESCDECAKEHRQFAAWLKELKQWREFGRNNAQFINDCLIQKSDK